jgi:hypothetical protein
MRDESQRALIQVLMMGRNLCLSGLVMFVLSKDECMMDLNLLDVEEDIC